MRQLFLKQNRLKTFLLLLSPVFIWSLMEPRHLGAWFAEILPLFIGLFIMIKTYKTFPLTTFSYLSIFIGAVLMLVGSHYSYSYVPFCEWVQNSLGFERNNYDKIVHFVQGFIMATLMRELIVRKNIISSNNWINFFALSYAIALAAVWEIVEWFYVIIIVYFGVKEPESGFLGTQNYYWDAQADMFLASIGAIIALIVFEKYHKAQIKQLISSV
ncbi:MAG: DUF2238 domain-containing protein [Epsilonproteobacteria bacterium]|nr:DUF2238 domain-containing protein [Campylobacterota bacterium]